MKRLLTLCCIMVCLFAGSKRLVGSNRGFEIKVHNINQVEMSISNYGKFGQTATGNAGCWWPRGTLHNYIFGAGFWFGTIDSIVADTLVTIGYGPHGGEYECAPGLKNMPVSHPDAIIYMAPDNWPPPDSTFPMAPQIPISHQDSWCCYNDCDSSYHMPGDTRPIGLEVYQTVYAWSTPLIQDIIFFVLAVKNVSGHNLRNCYYGVATDCDIGNEAGSGNDRIAGIVGKWYVINSETLWVDALGYQWQETVEPGWGIVPGTIGFDLLQTPFDLQPGCDKDQDGIPDQYERDSVWYWNNLPDSLWDVDHDGCPDWRDASENPQLGMTAFKRFTLSLEPNIDWQRYLTLAGYNFQTGQYEPYDTVPSPPDDQRFLMASGPFNLLVDSTVTLVTAVLLANWYNIYLRPDTALVLVDKWPQYLYDMNWQLTSIEENSIAQRHLNELKIQPNPIVRNGTVSFTLSKSSTISVKLYNLAGQLVKEFLNGQKLAGNYNIKVNTCGLAQGTYFLVLEKEEGKVARSLIILR